MPCGGRSLCHGRCAGSASASPQASPCWPRGSCNLEKLKAGTSGAAPSKLGCFLSAALRRCKCHFTLERGVPIPISCTRPVYACLQKRESRRGAEVFVYPITDLVGKSKYVFDFWMPRRAGNMESKARVVSVSQSNAARLCSVMQRKRLSLGPRDCLSNTAKRL